MQGGNSSSLWVFPSADGSSDLVSWGQCGLVAVSSGPALSVLAVKQEGFVTLRSWSPNGSRITAMAWFDGRCTLARAEPLILVGYANGLIDLFSAHNFKEICHMRVINRVPSTIVWSMTHPYQFYVGTKDGKLYKLLFNHKTTRRMSMLGSCTLEHSIEFILQDSFPNTSLVVLSESGVGCCVFEPTFHPGDSFSLFDEFQLSGKILSADFYPGSSTYVLLRG